MKVVRNEKIKQRYLNELKNGQYYYNEKYDYELLKYEKGELIISPNFKVTDVYFIIEGNYKIYGIKEDGSSYSVNMEGKGSLLGDMEFVDSQTNMFVEAIEDVYCFSLSCIKYKTELEKDSEFLMYLLKHMVSRFAVQSKIDLEPQTLEEKVYTYLKDIEPTHSIYKIETVVSLLHCNRRQLQRVLKSLCERQIIKKIGKGHYELI